MTSRILLADDSITIQKVVNLTFADEGIEVVAVSNGEQAERRLSEICPDLVLADIFMPGKNGYELCEFVKQSPQFRHVPVVLLVGAFEPFNEAEARRVRADAHLTKPFESRTLVDTVRKLISMSGKPATGALPPEPSRDQQDVPALTPSIEASAVGLPAFNLDLSGMAPDWEVAQPAAQQQNSYADVPDPTPSNNAPLELDYGSFGTSQSASASFQAEVEEPQGAGFSFTRSVKDTAELPPIEAEQQAPRDAAPRGRTEPLYAHSAFSEGETATGTGDTFGAPFEVPQDVQGFKVRSTFGDPGRDSVIDFDKMDAPQSGAPDNIVSFDVDFSTSSDSKPSYDAPAEEPLASSTNEPIAEAQVNEALGEVAFGLVEERAPQSLSVDDPLGDILSVDPPQMQSVEHGVNGGVLYFPPQPSEASGSVSTRGHEPIDDAATLSQSPLDTEGPLSERQASVVHSGLSFEAFSPVLEEAVPAERSGWADDGNDVLSELMEPTGAASEGENAFTASEMWAVAETEFAAIDIEAVAVEEPPSIADFAESRDSETGFAFASLAAPVEQKPAPVAPTKAVEVAAVVNAPASDGLTLSPALIDEIVRRVIAEMGDAVVREIAWEVVPDCVERVVAKLSHEAAAKRM